MKDSNTYYGKCDKIIEENGRFTQEDLKEYIDASRIGFWKLEIRKNEPIRMYMDSKMETFMGIPSLLSPEECYTFLNQRVHPEDGYLMKQYVLDVMEGNTVVDYRYLHPTRGEIQVRCSGRRSKAKENGITIVGHARELDDMIYLGNSQLRENQLKRINRDLKKEQIETNNYYRNLMDMATCGIILYTLSDYKIIHMNSEALRIYGVKNIQEAQENIRDILIKTKFPDAVAFKKLLRLRQEEGAVDYECVVTNLNGDTSTLLARTETFTMPKGDAAVYTTFWDVSENVTLKNEKSILDALCIDYTSVYACDLLEDSMMLIKANLSEEDKELRKRMQMTYPKFSERIRDYYEHRLVKESAEDFLEKMKAENIRNYLSEHDRFVYRFRAKPNASGHQFFETKAVRLNNADGFKVVIGFRYIDDIIEAEEKNKKRLEDALISANKKNEVISAISKLYWQVFCVNLRKNTYKEVFTDGKFTMDDPSYIGLAKEDFLKAVNDFVSDDYRVALMEFLDHDTLPERLSLNDTIAMEYQSKYGFWVSARYVIQSRDDKGKALEVLFILQLIDEQKRKELDYQKKLEEAAKESKRANEAKTNFLRRMSHDIRTPLNGIIGLLSINESHSDDLRLVAENHKKMEASAKHLLSLINDVLQMSKLEDGNSMLTHEPIHLSNLSMDIINIISARALEAGIKWEYEIGKSLVFHKYIYGSPLHLRQIFLNIYSNCIKYNRPGGKIHTFVDNFQREDGLFVYHWIISDTGIGMSKEFLEHIFEPFAQERNDARSGNQGIGLGMAIVKSLIDQMGGSIKISSEEGIGSTFDIRIPFEIAPAPQEEKEDLEAEGNMEGLSLMLVEDNDLNAEIAQTLLSDEGAKITIVGDGKQAVELFENNHPGTFDAILMDIMMPVMDGLTATKTIRSLKRSDAKKIPIIAMTANAFKEDARKCLEAGMNAHLAKPLEINKVKQTIRKQIARRNL